MDISRLKSLTKGSKIIINSAYYTVADVDKGISSSGDVKEFTLKDNKHNKFLLQIVMDSSVSLWKIELDPLTNKPYFGENNLVRIRSIAF